VIVADTNVTVQLFIASNLTPLARRLFELDGRWVVPPVWPHEFLNVMATYAKTGGLSPAASLATWRQALDVFGNRILRIDPDAALQLAVERDLSAYDAQFISLALDQNAPCITQDRRLRDKFPGLAFSIEVYLKRLTR
jgi:predicted nucleic acid-binding protein